MIALHQTSEKAFFFEAKAGKTIQKEAYEVYRAFANRSRKLLLFISTAGQKYCIPLQAIRFVNSQEYVDTFPTNKRLPVDREGWIAPRLLSPERYSQWKLQYPNASGTPFRYFDLAALTRYKLAKEPLQTLLAG